jgi:hypothetical protein
MRLHFALFTSILLITPVDLLASKTSGQPDVPLMVDSRVFDAAMQKLQERQRQREQLRVHATARQPETVNDPARDEGPYGLTSMTARKMEMLRAYDSRVASARIALRQRLVPANEVRRLVMERSAFLSLPIERFRDLMIEVDEHNAQRLERFQEAFGDLPTAARTVTVILMKSGQIDFATPLPEDPLTREVEESRGVRRAYFQFYLNPPKGTPRRHNGWVEFIYDKTSGLWVPTWTDYSGEPIPLFDAEAFSPLRPYELAFDGKSFKVSQLRPIQAPEVFALLTPRWTAGPVMLPQPRNRW